MLEIAFKRYDWNLAFLVSFQIKWIIRIYILLFIIILLDEIP